MIANLLNLRNVAILAGLMATAFAVQSLRIKHKNSKIEKLKAEITSLEITVSKFDESQQTNLTALAKVRAAHQQCAQSRELNEQNAEQELARQQGVLADLTSKYKKVKDYADSQKAESSYICGYKVYIDPELVNQLYKN